jgi:hypothetical protein
MVPSCTQSVHFARLLATRFDAGHPHLLTPCLSGRTSGRTTRANAGRTLRKNVDCPEAQSYPHS